jgi:hypothetical protein
MSVYNEGERTQWEYVWFKECEVLLTLSYYSPIQKVGQLTLSRLN